MSLTIDEIYDKEFALKGGGYDRNDVDQFLDEICDEMTNMNERIQALEAENRQVKLAAEVAQEAVKPAQRPVEMAEATVARTSETLEGILLSAQRLSDEALENAKHRAEEIINEAQEQAGHLVDEAQEEKTTLEKELNGLKKAAFDYRSSFLALVNKHKQILDEKGKLFEGAQKE